MRNFVAVLCLIGLVGCSQGGTFEQEMPIPVYPTDVTVVGDVISWTDNSITEYGFGVEVDGVYICATWMPGTGLVEMDSPIPIDGASVEVWAFNEFGSSESAWR